MEAEKTYQNKVSRTIQQKRGGEGALEFVDNRSIRMLQPIVKPNLSHSRYISMHKKENDNNSNIVQYESISGTFIQDSILVIEDNNGRIAINGVIFNKIRNAALHAINVIKNTISYLENHGPDNLLVQVAFDINSNDTKIYQVVKENYNKILSGLSSNKLHLKDISADFASMRIKGYVNSFLGIRYGPIYTRFDNEPNQITLNIIHEGSHLWANTVDVMYLEQSWSIYENLMNEFISRNPNMQQLAKVKNGHNNADSYSIFAFRVNNLNI